MDDNIRFLTKEIKSFRENFNRYEEENILREEFIFDEFEKIKKELTDIKLELSSIKKLLNNKNNIR